MPRHPRAGKRRIAGLFGLASTDSRGVRLHSERLEARHLLTVSVAPVQLLAAQGYLTPPSADEPLAIIDRFLRDNAQQLGATADDLTSYRVTDLYTSDHNGVTHVYLRQQVGGLDVLGADLNVNLTADGEIINVGASFFSGLVTQADTFDATPKLGALDAVQAAAGVLGYPLTAVPQVLNLAVPDFLQASVLVAAPGLSLDDVPLGLAWAPVEGGVELSWNMIVRTPDGNHWYDLAVSAADGELLWGNDWSNNATYLALPIPVEAPHDGAFELLVDIHHPVASPYGWHDTNGVAGPESTYTIGNNVSAQEDLDNNNQATDANRANGGPNLEFVFPFVPGTTLPILMQNLNASITNLFVWNNLIHDVLYQYGFNEVSGNFQTNNYGRGGSGNDAVQADALDGSGTDNANFSTPPDGLPGRMQMYRWRAGSNLYDSSFDNGIIAHEYGHGLSNRLTGGPGNANALRNQQSGGMGEGWSDWLALMLLQRPEDQKLGSIGIGTYVLGQSTSGRGIRRYPYSFDMDINPLTLGRYNQSNQVHDAGEIWCSALWDMNWLLIDKYGYDSDIYHGSGGNNLTMQLVLDGMKLQPSNPSFLQARDAILLADRNLTGGENQVEIWTAFARRGFGFGAVDGGSNSLTVVESFVVPDLGLHVVSSTPADGVILTTPTSDFTIVVESDYDPASVQPSDFLLNGIPADSVTLVNATTITFHYVNSPAAVQGVFTMSLPADSLTRASDGDGLTPFAATFRYDTLQLAVTAVRPANNSVVTLPLTAIELDFNEPVAPGSVDISDLAINLGSVIAAELLDADTVRYVISGIDSEDTLLVTLKGGSVTDVWGNPTLGFSASYTLDADTIALPALTPYELRGSLVYGRRFSGILGSLGDVDLATFSLDAGQRVTLLIDPSTNVAPLLELRGPDGTVLGSVAPLPGKDGVLSEISADVAGVYTIAVQQTGSSLGSYRIEVLLNAVLEAESANGPTNDTIAAAQSIDAAFAPLPLGGQRAAVLGYANPQAVALTNEIEPNETIAQATVAVADFVSIGSTQRFQQSTIGTLESGDDVDWYYIGNLETGDVLTTAALGVAASRGTHSDTYLELWRANGGTPLRVAKDDNSGGGRDALIYRQVIGAPDQYYLRVSSADAAKAGTYELTLWLEDFGPDPITGLTFPGEIEGNDTLDSANDMSRAWTKVGWYSRIDGTLDYNDRDVYQVLLTAGDRLTVFGEASLLDMGVRVLDAAGNILAEDDGTSDGPNNNSWVYSFTAPASGMYYVEYRTVQVRTGSYKAQMYLSTMHDPPVPSTGDDYFSLTLAAGERISLAATILEFGEVGVSLTDAAGGALISAAPGTRSVIDDWQAPAAGQYLIRIRGLGPYNLVVTRSAGFDSRDNDTLALAQRLDESGRMLGAIDHADEADVFHFTVAAGQTIHIATATPGGGANQPANALDPRIELYGPGGTLVASDDNSAPDGRNAELSFLTLAGGNYRVRIVGAGGSTGDYTLQVTGKSPLATVRNVTLGSGQGYHDDYVIPTGSGEQLRTPPVGFVDRISIAFDREVVVALGDLTLVGARHGAYPLASFDYDAVNFVATWTLAAPLVRADELTLTLADSVQNLQGSPLDGEWANPTSLSDDLSSSGSGDGVAGGAFVFRFNILPGDANRDNHVDGADFNLWANNFGIAAGTATFALGDFNGDGRVNGADFTLWSDNFGLSQLAGVVPAPTGVERLPEAVAAPSLDPQPDLAPAAESQLSASAAAPAVPQVSLETPILGLKRRAVEQNVADVADWLRDEAIDGLSAAAPRRRLLRA